MCLFLNLRNMTWVLFSNRAPEFYHEHRMFCVCIKWQTSSDTIGKKSGLPKS